MHAAILFIMHRCRESERDRRKEKGKKKRNKTEEGSNDVLNLSVGICCNEVLRLFLLLVLFKVRFMCYSALVP